MSPRQSAIRKAASVILQPGATRRRAKRWAYGYADLASLLGLSQGTLRNRVSAGWVPTLSAICAEWHRRTVIDSEKSQDPKALDPLGPHGGLPPCSSHM
jgi:hypothetical protein